MAVANYRFVHVAIANVIAVAADPRVEIKRRLQEEKGAGVPVTCR
jgi:hypothetical protein